MGVTIGTQLGSHVVAALLGRGGMGEVWRARDSKLKREVALKILPDEFSRDPERVARFQREAQVLASLNHPNIAQIYGLEDSTSRRCIVMELVEGETLAERLRRGPIPLNEALQMAKQIADGLEAAHEKGIVHRDLKSANIKITPAGQVKVLDFGLAKVREAEAATAFSNSPTLLSGSTPGVIIGTVAYMSPEQAKGKETDRTTDVWAFGCVLYEMLTGRPVFTGETVGEILAEIFKADPDWRRLPPEAPESIRRLLRRCLQKERTLRLRDIGDARLDITEAQSPPEVSVTPHSTKAKTRVAWAVALIATAAAGILAAVVIHDRRSPGQSPVVRFFVSAPDKTTFMSGVTAGFGHTAGRISPDGRKLAFTARDESGKVMLWVRSLDSLTAQPLPGTDGAGLPFWSPDSRSVGFFTTDEKLKKVDVNGGLPQTLCDSLVGNRLVGRGGTWNRDGVILFGVLSERIFRVSSRGGKAVPVTKLIQHAEHRYPIFLPDGNHFLYFAQGSPENSGVYVGALDTSDSVRLAAADSQAVYVPQGYLLFVRQGTLVAQSFNPAKLQLSGEPIPIAEHVAIGGVGAFSVSDEGTLVYRTIFGGNPQGRVTWTDRNGKIIEAIGMPASYSGLDLSPDGKQVAAERVEGNGSDIWIIEASGNRTSRWTFDPSQQISSPVWSPDGTRIVFSSLRSGKWGLYRKLSTGAGNEELLLELGIPAAPVSWSADARFILYVLTDPKSKRDVWALPTTGDRKPFPVLNTPFNEERAQMSPDGKWIAYQAGQGERNEIYVESFPPGSGKWQISNNGGQLPRWRRDGKELFYMDGAINFRRAVSAGINTSGAKSEFSPPQRLFEIGRFEDAPLGPSNHYAVSADGQRILLPRVETQINSEFANIPLTVVVNWPAALKK